MDPHTLDFPASLKQYAEWFRYTYPQQASDEDIADKTAEQEAGDGSKPRNGIKARWEKYKKDFLAMQVSRFLFFRSYLGRVLVMFPQIWGRYVLLAEFSLYRSCKHCLIITRSRPGLRRSMTLLRNSRTYAKGYGKSDGEEG